MSFEQKKRSEPDMDKLNIKYHLNASLETEGISVSEDLINRTLDAIKKQKDQGFDEKLANKKPTHLLRRTRLIITTGAAVLILMLGMTTIRLLSPEKKADQVSPESYNMTAMDKSEIYGNAIDGSEVQMSVIEDANILEADEEFVDIYVRDFTEEQDDSSMELTSKYRNEFKFADIISMEPMDVKSVTITSESMKKTISLTKRVQLDQFYSIMENHSFLQEEGERSDVQYIIKIIGEDTDSQITIGIDSIEVDHTDKDVASHSVYVAADHSKLIEDLEELLE